MLTKRLFMFGYETPGEAERNVNHGWDDESNTGIWIVSASEEDAIEWGRTVAEQFVSSLFGHDSGRQYSWTEANFAHWIEADPTALAAACNLPVVAIGELPDFATLSGPPKRPLLGRKLPVCFRSGEDSCRCADSPTRSA